MSEKLTRREFDEQLTKLGVTPLHFHRIQETNIRSAIILLGELQKAARSAYKRVVFDEKLHPDQGGDGEAFRKLTAALEVIDNLKVKAPRPPPVRQHFVGIMRITLHQQGWVTFSNSSATNTTGFGFRRS